MKKVLNLATLLSLALYGCAPVTSSVPKMGSQRPRSDDSIADRREDRSIDASRSEVIAKDAYPERENKISQTHNILKLNRQEVDAFKKDQEVSIPLVGNALRMEVAALIELKVEENDLDKELLNRFAFTIRRDENKNERVWIVVSQDKTSKKAWSYVKENIVGISLAYREIDTR